LIDATDIFSTIAEVAGVSVNRINDSRSFKSLFTNSSTIRKYQYSEIKDGADDMWAISNGTYKLIVNATGANQLYFLASDPYEANNLLNATLTSAQTAARNELEAELRIIRQ
ncbi:MAG: sulfatase, partial [Bacteroidetes bacterium]